MKANHFGREAKITAWIFSIFILLALIGGFFVPWLLKQAAIDKCLDSGGAVDYETRACIYTRRQG
jgi:hypothetical protein